MYVFMCSQYRVEFIAFPLSKVGNVTEITGLDCHLLILHWIYFHAALCHAGMMSCY